MKTDLNGSLGLAEIVVHHSEVPTSSAVEFDDPFHDIPPQNLVSLP